MIKDFHQFLNENNSSSLISLEEIQGAQEIKIQIVYQYRIECTDAYVYGVFNGREEELGNNYFNFNIDPEWGEDAAENGKTCEEILDVLFDENAKNYIRRELEKQKKLTSQTAKRYGLSSPLSVLFYSLEEDDAEEMQLGETYYVEEGSDS